MSLVVNDGLEDSEPYNVTVVATLTQNQVIQDLDKTINVKNTFDPNVFKNKNMQKAVACPHCGHQFQYAGGINLKDPVHEIGIIIVIGIIVSVILYIMLVT